MKKWTLVIVLLSLKNVFSQELVPDQKLLQAFYKTKTCFVLYKDSVEGYDNAIEWIAKKVWRTTPYELISAEDYEKNKKNPKFSFVTVECIPIKIKDKTMKVDHLVLSMPTKDKKAESLITLVKFPLAYEQMKNKSYLYKIPAILMFFQTYLEYISTHSEIKTFEDYLKYCNGFNTEVGEKELWVLKEDIDPELTEERLSEIYEGEIKIVTEGELQENIRKQALDFSFVHRISSNKPTYENVCKLYVLTADGACLFFTEFISNEKNPCYLRQEHLKKFKKK